MIDCFRHFSSPKNCRLFVETNINIFLPITNNCIWFCNCVNNNPVEKPGCYSWSRLPGASDCREKASAVANFWDGKIYDLGCFVLTFFPHKDHPPVKKNHYNWERFASHSKKLFDTLKSFIFLLTH